MSDSPDDHTPVQDDEQVRSEAHIRACALAAEALELHELSTEAQEPESQRALALEADKRADKARQHLRRAKGLPTSDPPVATPS